MLYELIHAFFFIFMAEMGDKTQILAMAFATKYPLHKVLLGVFIGSFINHGLAVLLGSYVTHIIPLDTIRLLAAFAFVGFGLWTIKIEDDEDEDEEETKFKFGPIVTVALAFFIGELGDKTQLTAITLSSQAQFPAFILMGTVLGMVFTSGMGVFVGSRLGKKIPELTLKLVSASIFIIFGIMSLLETVPTQYQTFINIIVFFSILAVLIAFKLSKIVKKIPYLYKTPFKKLAGELYINTHKIQQSLENVCTGDEECVACQEGNCPIKSLNEHLIEAQQTEKFLSDVEWDIPLCENNKYNVENIKESLIETVNTCLECRFHQKNCVGNQTRVILEKLYFGETIPYKGNRKEYLEEIKKRQPDFFNELKS